MALLIIPEIQLKNIIQAIFLYIKTDYASNGDDGYLARLVDGLSLDKYDLYDQAVEIFITRGKDSPKELKCRLGFDSERASVPTIHIILSEDTGGPDGLGVDEGVNEHTYNSTDKTTKNIKNRSFNTRLSIIITSEGNLEVVTIYHILRSALVSVFDDLQFAGIQNPKLSGGTIQLYPGLVPDNIFQRVINLDFFYDVPAPNLFTASTFNDLVVQGVAITGEDDSSS